MNQLSFPTTRFSLLSLFVLASLAACGGGTPAGEVAPGLSSRERGSAQESMPQAALIPAGEQAPEQDRALTSSGLDFTPGGPIADADLGAYHVVMGVEIDGKDAGQMSFAFWPEVAPITVRNFLRLTNQGVYDGLTFHRVLRDFMVQGGCRLGNGLGDSPLGPIRGEFHSEPEWRHRYGVLSMARAPGQPNSAGSQFFLINHDGLGAWNLDGDYASFGRLTSGVATLEALSDIPVRASATTGELSQPTLAAVIRFARVIEGPAPTGEEIERPVVPVDLGGEPAEVTVKSMLIGFEGSGTRATRSREEAQALAEQLVERVRAGEDFETLAREFSDDPLHVGMEAGEEFFGFRLLNHGIRDPEGERKVMDMNRQGQARAQELAQQQAEGSLSRLEFNAEIQKMKRGLEQELRRLVGFPRNQLGSLYGVDDVAFGLEVGGVDLVEWSREKSRNGWYVIQRAE